MSSSSIIGSRSSRRAGTRDGAYGHADDFGGDIFEKPEFYWLRSPLRYAKNVKTPTLVLHSDNDFRVPIEQGEQMFISLKKLGRTTEFVRFPDENHNLSRSGKPAHRAERLRHILRWFATYL